MNILFINHVGEFSGAEKQLLNLSDALFNETDIQFNLWLANPVGKLSSQATSKGIQHTELPSIVLVRSGNPLDLLKYLWVFILWTRKLIKFVRTTNIDVLHANSFTSAIFSWLASKLVRKPIIWHMHDILKVRRMNSYAVIVLSKLVDEIVCVSQAVKDSLTTLGVDPALTTVIYNSVYAPLPVSQMPMDEAKKRLGYTHDTLLVGMIGQIAEWKGHHIFIDAISELAKRGFEEDVKFLIIGDAISKDALEYKDKISQQIINLNLGRDVFMLGFRNDIPDILQSLDILVHCSVWHDPFPTVLLEGLAHHKCIVASRLGGVPEIINDRKSGKLFSPRDVKELSDILGKLLSNPGERQKLSEGAKIGKDQFNPSANFQKFLDVYSDNCSQRGQQ